ncbi:MAG: hypothetical protein K2Y28_00545 [Burkholderiaceae bacterium]|nr:hypothetical protein [Burkholderiaceae bacterium]
MSAQFQNNDFAGMSGLSGMNDPLGFVKKLWGDMQLPGMVTPTISVDELDKKIQDLKTVESWLNVNMNMLKGTIQALEVQRATISTLKTMGENFAQQMKAATPAPNSSASTPSTSTTINESWPHSSQAKESDVKEGTNANWPMPNAAQAAPIPAKEPASPPEVTPEVLPEITSPPVEKEASNASKAASGEAKATPVAANAQGSAPFSNPAAWWNVLQDQFKQALTKAMESEQLANLVKSTTTKTADAKSKAPHVPFPAPRGNPIAKARSTATRTATTTSKSTKPAKPATSNSAKPKAAVKKSSAPKVAAKTAPAAKPKATTSTKKTGVRTASKSSSK